MQSVNPFKRPFPDREFDRSNVLGMARIGIFVFAFLYILRPGGMETKGNFLLTCLGYGLVTFLVSVGYSYVTLEVFKWKKSGDRWTLGRWILDCALLLLLISLGNFLYYNATVGWTAFYPVVFFAIVPLTVLVGLFPIAFSGMAIQLRAERENQRAASSILLQTLGQSAGSDYRPAVTLGERDELTLPPGEILYCEARQNYVNVHYRSQEGVEETQIRATLASMSDALVDTRVIRCHRSFLVNLDHVLSVTGNAQGLRLRLAGLEESIPVSRTYVQRVKNHLAVRP